jgi:hypothetical protein
MTTKTTAPKINYVAQYNAFGAERFYNFLLSEAKAEIFKIKNGEYKGTSPELRLIETSERFLQFFRREGNDVHLELARIFRRAGHRIYRIMLKSKMIGKSPKFLNLA